MVCWGRPTRIHWNLFLEDYENESSQAVVFFCCKKNEDHEMNIFSTGLRLKNRYSGETEKNLKTDSLASSSPIRFSSEYFKKFDQRIINARQQRS